MRKSNNLDFVNANDNNRKLRQVYNWYTDLLENFGYVITSNNRDIAVRSFMQETVNFINAAASQMAQQDDVNVREKLNNMINKIDMLQQVLYNFTN